MLDCFIFIFKCLGQIITFLFFIPIDDGIYLGPIILIILFLIIFLRMFFNKKGGSD